MHSLPDSLLATRGTADAHNAERRLYSPYRSYKQTGLDWMPRMPSHWELLSLKRLVRMRSGNGITSEAIVPEGKYPVYGGNGLRGYADDFTHDGHFPLIGRQGALCGNVNYASGRFWASEHAVVVQPTRPVAIKWLGELLRAMSLNQYSISAAQPGLAVDAIRELPIPLPPLPEQRAIADFLDRETGRIDSLIDKKKRLIELLEEKRSALISHAVTKGLNPDAPMKPSGIDWLGDIPEHWEVLPLKRLTKKIGSGVTPRGGSESYVPEGVALLRSQNIHFSGLRLGDVAFITNEVHQSMATTTVMPHDILLNITGASIGRCCLVPTDMPPANVNQHVCIVRTNSLINSRYLNAYLSSYYGQTQVFCAQTGTSREGLNFEQLGGFIVTLPDPDEQSRIADFIHGRIGHIDGLIKKNYKIIDLLQERRLAIISAAVTGKIYVMKEALNP